MLGWNAWRAAALIAATLGLAGTTGCGASAEEANVRRATTAFFADVSAHQDRRACADLAPQAAQGLTTSDSGCAEEIGKLKLTGGTIRAVRVWGERAQVLLSDDTVFLARVRQGWKVTAAGCRKQTKGPYDCDVEA
jgi:hypothetical protein